ncbi:hypothetical protein [Paenibacillus tarimensis]|uniref:hypothetical protein n=1 Tax=Paenibacillus tarimensis TaxID=416012 RepID=UPI001F17CF98|nr:hypothetical protein [Paenibacillus tarimensis]MCF2945440.1 hypothetical protein [Paenibacillus tarimensis]
MRKHIKLNIPELNIHPLRITEGWSVKYNNFWQIDPKSLEHDDDRWFMFTESLLQLYHEKSSTILDLGWNPDLSPEGSYLVLIVKNMDWDNPIYEFESDDYNKIIQFIELQLKTITAAL